MLVILRVFVAIMLMLLTVSLFFTGALMGSSFFGGQLTTTEIIASRLSLFASLSSLVMIGVLVLYRDAKAKLLIAAWLYIGIIFGATLMASYFYSHDQAYRGSPFEIWTSIEVLVAPQYIQMIIVAIALLLLSRLTPGAKP